MSHAVILDAVRTPFGKFGGALSSIRPDDLAASAIESVVDRANVAADAIGDVYLGCANQAGEDNRDVARMAVLLAGLPVSVPGCTVNRLCGSGMEAVAIAARSVQTDDHEVVIAGGVESMTRAPWALAKPARGFARGPAELEDTALGWRFINPQMVSMGHTDALGVTAENVAREYGVSREEQDRFALASHAKAAAAIAAERAQGSLIPVETKAGAVTGDEGPRADASLETLGRLRPVFADDGSVTAGNSSPLSDGAAAVVVASADASGLGAAEPLARVIGSATAGVEPRLMGLGPIPATRKLLDKLGMTISDFDVIELNEAFASQAIAVCRDLGIDPEDERLNPNGGAIALGHPLGASGARLVGDVVHELDRTRGRYGLATMCIGVGQGIALAVERL